MLRCASRSDTDSVNKIQLGRNWVTGRSVIDKKPIHVHDLLSEGEEFPEGKEFARRLGHRTILAVPLLLKGDCIGAINLRRTEVHPFSEKQIALLQTFANQAVIAIENARLFNETKEALERQTATADILNVIASSPTDVQPVLRAIVESACELCDAHDAVVLLRDGDHLCFSEHHGPIAINIDKWPISRGWAAGRAFIDQTTVHVPDIHAEEASDFTGSRALSERTGSGGVRSILAVPLLRENESVGAILLRREEVRPFNDKQIALLQTFADQAVIAIENARLFNEVQARTEDLRESLQQQTATADVLKVISRSTFDLQTVLDTLVESVTRLCEADHAWLFQRDGDLLHFKSSFGHDTEIHARLRELFLSRPAHIDRGSIVGRSALDGRVVHLTDVLANSNYKRGDAQQIGGYRAALGAPLLRDGNVVGVIFVAKTKPEPYTEKQIELVTTFADQAVIAIENVRLFDEVKATHRRPAGVAAAADGDCRCAESDQPLDVRPRLRIVTLVGFSHPLCEAETGLFSVATAISFAQRPILAFPRELEAFARANPLPAAARVRPHERALQGRGSGCGLACR